MTVRRPYGAFRTVMVVAAASLVSLLALGVEMKGHVLSGVYAGPGGKGVAGVRSFENWRDKKADIALDFSAEKTWWDISKPDWQLKEWAQSSSRLVFAFAPYPNGKGSLSECAQGAYNDRYVTLARRLISHSLHDAILRPGWEFNGDWYEWSAVGKADQYANCFRQIVISMRNVSGAQFEFTWNVSVGRQKMDARQAWPGSEYVDHLGVDVYDMSWEPQTYPYNLNDSPAARFARQRRVSDDLFGEDFGLRFWLGFARQHDVPLAIPEWGVVWRPDGKGGLDNPHFIAQMANFLNDNAQHIAYESYFQWDKSSVRHDLTTNQFPESADRYLERFGGGSVGGIASEYSPTW